MGLREDVVVIANPISTTATRALAAAGYTPAATTTRHTIFTLHEGEDETAPGPQPAAVAPRVALTVAEAADLLGISTSHAYELVHTGAIPAIRLGRRVLIPHRSIQELLGTFPRHNVPPIG